MLEQEGGDTRYGYGWVIQRDEGYGRVAWHDGGNAWGYSLFTRLLDEGMVFWTTNGYRDKDAGWNLTRLEPRLTRGVADRVLSGA